MSEASQTALVHTLLALMTANSILYRLIVNNLGSLCADHAYYKQTKAMYDRALQDKKKKAL